MLLLRSKGRSAFFRPLLGQFLVLLLYPNGLLGNNAFQDFFVSGRSESGKAIEKTVSQPQSSTTAVGPQVSGQGSELEFEVLRISEFLRVGPNRPFTLLPPLDGSCQRSVERICVAQLGEVHLLIRTNHDLLKLRVFSTGLPCEIAPLYEDGYVILKHRPLLLSIPLVVFLYRPPSYLQRPLIVPPKVFELKPRICKLLLQFRVRWYLSVVKSATSPLSTLRKTTGVIFLGFRGFFPIIIIKIKKSLLKLCWHRLTLFFYWKIRAICVLRICVMR